MCTQKGFTLIELMLVIAVIGLLATIALPSYQNYLTRAQVSEGFQLISPIKIAVNEWWEMEGRLPVNLTDIGMDTNISSKYVKAISVSNGDIIIEFNPETTHLKRNENTLIFSPQIVHEQLIWDCKKGNLKKEYRPQRCK